MSVIDDNNYGSLRGTPKLSGVEDFEGEIIVRKIYPRNSSKKFSNFIPRGTNEVNLDGIKFTASASGKIYVSDQIIRCENIKYPFNKIVRFDHLYNNMLKSVETTIEIIVGDERSCNT